MEAVDYERLNDAAKLLHDVAFARGKMAGREEAGHETVEHVGRGMLGIAAGVLRLAADLDDAHDRRRAAQLARMVYGRTPGGTGFAEGRIAPFFDGVLRSNSDIDVPAARALASLLDTCAGVER
jgi:hypothetical protein